MVLRLPQQHPAAILSKSATSSHLKPNIAEKERKWEEKGSSAHYTSRSCRCHLRKGKCSVVLRICWLSAWQTNCLVAKRSELNVRRCYQISLNWQTSDILTKLRHILLAILLALYWVTHTKPSPLHLSIRLYSDLLLQVKGTFRQRKAIHLC